MHSLIACEFTELLIDGLARASPIDDPEACVYGYGAVRFLTNTSLATSASVNKEGSDKTNNKNKTLAQRLVRHGIVPLMIIHLQVINEAVIYSRFHNYTNIDTNMVVVDYFAGGK